MVARENLSDRGFYPSGIQKKRRENKKSVKISLVNKHRK
jgi:hypothetical protein